MSNTEKYFEIDIVRRCNDERVNGSCIVSFKNITEAILWANENSTLDRAFYFTNVREVKDHEEAYRRRIKDLS